MTPAARLGQEVDVFDRIIQDLQAIASRVDPGRRSDLVTLRKRLSEQIVRMREIGAAAFVGDAVTAGDFRSRLSTALNLIALHQADWPAVAIDDGNAAYRASAAKVAETNRAFSDWTRAALARLR